jgi:SAM-dependent methyltransferase
MVLNKIGALLKFPTRDHVDFQGHTLPPKHLRAGGEEFQDDAFFLASAQREARRLVDECGLKSDMRVLDVGCGYGRLPTGILSVAGDAIDYLGIDVRKSVVSWCSRYIAGSHPRFTFTHLDRYNDRYNPDGQRMDTQFRLPVDDCSLDIIYLYSVFSHLIVEDIREYLREFHRTLAPAGRIFLTLFVEDDVPEMEVNPKGYIMGWSGQLHCVRYNRAFFVQLVQGWELKIDNYVHGRETDGQSAFYLSHAGKLSGSIGIR